MNSEANDVAVIVTTFNPDLLIFENNLDSYLSQASLVVVCDNSDCKSVSDLIRNLCLKLTNVAYLSMGGNKGIAYAQNRGVEFAIEQGFDYFLEMDQDSNLPVGYISNILSSYFLLILNNIPVAGVGPVARSKSQDFIYHDYEKDSGIKFVSQTLSSGFLYGKNSYMLVGSKDESLFIDFVDWDWCWRARKLGMYIAVDTSIVMEHMLGDGHKKIFGFYVGLPSPIRLYYQYRNSLYMLQRDYVGIGWKIKRLIILLFKVPYFLLLTDRKIDRMRFIVKGVFGFFRGDKGQFNESSK